MYEIIEKKAVVPNIHILKISAPFIASKILAGQFIIVMNDMRGERIPLTIADWDEETITTVFMEVGTSTHKLAELKAGDSLPVVVGPLGRPSSCNEISSKTVVCAGGCYGIGAIFPIVRALKERGNKVISIIEARSKYLIYWEEKLRQVSDELIITTKDGSGGDTFFRRNIDRTVGDNSRRAHLVVKKGYASVILKELLEERNGTDCVYAMGCTFMMMSCSEATKETGIPIMVSLNSIMVDGTGMCGACRVEVDGKTKFACVDGPEFNGNLVNFELLVKRRAIYLMQERESVQRM